MRKINGNFMWSQKYACTTSVVVVADILLHMCEQRLTEIWSAIKLLQPEQIFDSM